MVATLTYAGLRREELLWLHAEDFLRETAQAPNILLRIQAKTIAGESWQPMTKKNRAVPVSRDLRRYLDEYDMRASKCGWIFPSPTGLRWDPDNFSHALRAMNEAESLPWFSLDYRHTFGSLLAQRGVSLYQIATLMGNSPDICRRHYAALSHEQMGQLTDFT